MIKQKHNQQGFHHLAILIVIVVAIAGFAGYKVFKTSSTTQAAKTKTANGTATAEEAGKTLSSNHCSGSGTTTFKHLPMDAADFNILIPYGLTVGGHVTPIDHQYFSPTIFNSPADKYPVYAMADAQITDIEVHPPENGSKGRIRLVFTVSCTFFYYYDLVTSVEPGIDKAHLPVSVKAGQLIGHIGGQTLDFAVWNTEKKLNGFINPSTYSGEGWKIYTDNPFLYYTDELRKIVESKDPRTVEPIQGKIDYDVDGKLVGNWFVEGSGGYSGSSGNQSGYWQGHLSIAPDLYDPSASVLSIGNYDSYPNAKANTGSTTSDGSGAHQFFAKSGSLDPAKIGQSDGLVKIEYVQRDYLKPDGSPWANQSEFVKGPSAKTGTQAIGTVLAQLTGSQKLKFEVFPGKTADQVSAFDSNAKTYTR